MFVLFPNTVGNFLTACMFLIWRQKRCASHSGSWIINRRSMNAAVTEVGFRLTRVTAKGWRNRSLLWKHCNKCAMYPAHLLYRRRFQQVHLRDVIWSPLPVFDPSCSCALVRVLCSWGIFKFYLNGIYLLSQGLHKVFRCKDGVFQGKQ